MDGSGEIDREELTKIARIIYNNKFAQELFGLKIDETLFSVEQFVNKFFEEADSDGNGTPIPIPIPNHQVPSHSKNSNKWRNRIEIVVLKHHGEKSVFMQRRNFKLKSNRLTFTSDVPAHSWGIELDNTIRPDHDPINIIITGPPGSGKTTQCQNMSIKYNLVHISAGKLLRDEILRKSELSEKIQRCFDAGILVPDDVVAKVIEQRLEAPDCERNGN
jgi:hypothetical protein